MKTLYATFRREQIWKRKCLCIVWSEGSRHSDSMARVVVANSTATAVAAVFFFVFACRPLHYGIIFFNVSHFFYNQHSSESCEQQGKLGIQIGDITGFHQHQQQIQQKKNHTKCGQIKWVNKTAKWNENIRNEKLLRKIENSTEKKQHFQRKKKRWIFSFACQFINLLICFVCHVIIPVASNSCRWYKLLLSLQLWS